MFRENPFFCTDRFHDLLGRLERFDLFLAGGVLGRLQLCRSDGYVAFVSKLDKHFFHHLESITHFSL